MEENHIIDNNISIALVTITTRTKMQY